jgi:hypothetical protein
MIEAGMVLREQSTERISYETRKIAEAKFTELDAV